ncbi:NAD(P)-binding protein [Flavobacteriaceae bacterium R38]|nr:NAD(P)-binding protein [Flavobacteriaceae bacterium R38]
MQTSKKIAIVGSGLVGSLLAIYLRRKGHKVDIFDRRPDIRNIEFSGRSINLAMSTRGWQALDRVGLGDEIRKIAIAMNKRAIHVLDKPMYFQHYGKEGEAIYSISRGLLNKKMIDLAEREGARFIFESKVMDVTLAGATLHVGSEENETWESHKYDLIFGADGAFSRTRHKMQRRSRFDYSQKFLNTGYKELTIPPNSDGTHKLEKNSLHIWPRGEFMLIALPNLNGSFTCTLFMPFEGENSFESLNSEKKVQAFFESNFPFITEDINNLTRDFFNNPTSALVTIKCYPWTYWDKVALVGDSAHAIVPFYGQGMNAGFEDIRVLDDLMNLYEDDWETIFKEYEKQRKSNTDAIAELSYRNFVEMSSKTADKNFLLRKKIEKWFSEKHPDKWVPLYSRVTFSNEPYEEALRLGDMQKEVMDEVMKANPDVSGEEWDHKKIEEDILNLLKNKAKG